MNKEITIIVDYNDGDYLTEVSIISKKDLKKIKPLIALIKANMGVYPYGEAFHNNNNEVENRYKLYKEIKLETFSILEDYCPDSEYGFHSIESITVAPVVEKERLL